MPRTRTAGVSTHEEQVEGFTVDDPAVMQVFQGPGSAAT
jgi:hypothetical protein